MPRNAVKTRFTGVFYIESQSRRHNGKPDVCYYYTTKIDGKKKWVKVGWKSEGYSAIFANDQRGKALQVARHGGETSPSKKVSIVFSDAWKEYQERHLCQLRTAKSVTLLVQKNILPIFGDKRMESITTADIETFRNQKLAEGLSPQTVTHLLGYINRVYRQTAIWGLHTAEVPTAQVKKPRVDNRRIRFLTRIEAKLLLEDLKKRSLVWHDLALTSLVTGARLSELRFLTIGKVNLDAGVMEVDGKVGRRMIQLSDVAKKVIGPRIAGGQSSDYVFPSPFGGVISISATAFKRSVKAVGLNPAGTNTADKVVFHTLRHTFASWLAIDGIPLIVIKELLGHANISMTMRYSHLCPDSKKAAVQALGDSLHISL